jgi:hypothetical protein
MTAMGTAEPSGTRPRPVAVRLRTSSQGRRGPSVRKRRQSARTPKPSSRDAKTSLRIETTHECMTAAPPATASTTPFRRARWLDAERKKNGTTGIR